MVEAWRDWLSAWRDFRIAMDELLELDDERILALVEATGQGKSSGLELGPMRQKAASLFHIRKGKVTRFVFWWDRERALADLGLASERNR
jgi:ketosteroid isomerase-like protein